MAKIKSIIEEAFLSVLRKNDIRITDDNLRYFTKEDWDLLLGLVVKSGILPAFYRILSASGTRNISPGFLTRLKECYLLNLKNNILLQRELLEIISSFKENDISFVPLKGPALAKFLYEDISERQASVDLDLLVRKEHFDDAQKALEKAGYAHLNRNQSEFRQRFFLKYSREVCFVKNNFSSGRSYVDLHWDLRGLFAYTPLEDFWHDLIEIDIEGEKVMVPSHESLLLYLGLAAVMVTEDRQLRYLYDTYTLVNKFKDKIDWPALSAQLKGSRHKTCIFFVLTMAQEFFNFQVPEEFLRQIKPGPFKRSVLGIWIRKNNFIYPKVKAGRIWYFFVLSCLYSRNILDCMRIIYRKIFLPKEEMAGLYNAPESLANYFLYFTRIFKPPRWVLQRK